MAKEKEFNKYKNRGSMHWHEMMSRDIRKFNAFQQGRYDWILKSAGDINGKRILDMGCGDGALTYLLTKRGAELVGIDNNELGIDFARQNLAAQDSNHRLKYQFLVASGYSISLPTESFDLVVNSEVIEHVAEPEKMLAEACRVLKTGGVIILTTPHRLNETPHDPNHVLEYFPGEMERMLKKYFSQVELKLTHHVFWYGLYTYSFRRFSNRQFGKWLVNALTLWFGFNPFRIEYTKPTKHDVFTQILAVCRK